MTALIRQEDGSILMFDSIESERYSPSVLVTAHPVENGAPVTDNARQEQLPIVLSGRITETPLGLAPGLTGPARIQSAIAWLQASVGKLLDVQTADRGLIRNCLLTGWPNEKTHSRQMPITVSLQQVRIAAADFVRIPAVGPKRPTDAGLDGQPDTTDAGAQATSDARQSVGAILTDGVSSGVSDLASYLGWGG